jgi:outer membrane protein assembly factor BamE (lipoprotein component of BamABCDE complex)
MITNNIKRMKTNFYNFYTGFPPKMWKSQRTAFLSKTCVILLCLFLLVSCSYLNKITGKDGAKAPAKVQEPILENSLVSMNEEDVRNKLGEPTVVSLTAENRILWTYIPAWKLMPDNKDTVYVEFDNGKVVKVVKAKK